MEFHPKDLPISKVYDLKNENDATRFSDNGPIIKDGKKSLIILGNARVTKGIKKKNKLL